MRNRLVTRDSVHVPLTPAQSKRIQALHLQATVAAQLRDAVLSAIVESVVDEDFKGWAIQISETEIVLTAPFVSNSQADAMSP